MGFDICNVDVLEFPTGYWYALLDSQKQTVQALLETYRAEGIRDYEDFMEYRQEKHLLDAYREMTQTILESER